MTLRQEKDRPSDITFDSDPAWEAYGTKKKKDRESHRLGNAKKESRQSHRLGSANDGFGEASISSFALDDEGGLSNDWKSFTEDRGWNEMDMKQAKAWRTAQRERNMARGNGRGGSVSRGNSSSSSLDFDDFQEEPQPTPLKVNPSIGIRRVDRSASTRMVPKVKVNGLKHSTSESQLTGSEEQAQEVSPPSMTRQRSVRQNKSGDIKNMQLDGASEPTGARPRRRTSSAASLSLDNAIEGSGTGGRRAPQRTKSLDVDMIGTSDNNLGNGTTSSNSNPSKSQSFRLGALHEKPPGRSKRRASSVALNAPPPPPPHVQNPTATRTEAVRVRSRRRASLAVGAAPSSNVQDLQPDVVPNEAARVRSRRRASLAVNRAPDTAAGLQNLHLDTSNETPRIRTRRRASTAANDVNMNRRIGVQRTKSMDVDMLGSGDSRLGLGQRKGSSRALGVMHSFRNVRRIHSSESQDMSLCNASSLGNESASGITDETETDTPPPPPPPPQQSRSPLTRSPRTRSPRMAKNSDLSSNHTESAKLEQEDKAGPGRNRKNKLSPRSRRRLNIRRINSIDSTCSFSERDVEKVVSNGTKSFESPTTSRQTVQGNRRQGLQRVNSSGLQNLMSGLQSKKNAGLEAEMNGENLALESANTVAPKRLQAHLDDEKSTTAVGSADSVSNHSSAVSNNSSTNRDLQKTLTRARSGRIQKHIGKEDIPGEAGSVASGSVSHSSTERYEVTRSRSSRLKVVGGNSSSNSLKSGDSESIRSEQSRSTSSRLSRQRPSDNAAPGSTPGSTLSECERTPNSSRVTRKRRETPKRGVDRSKSIDDSMTFGAWTSGDSSVRSRKKLSKSPSRRKSVAAGECQPHSKLYDKERVKNGDNTIHSPFGPHDKGFITSFLGSAQQ